MLLDEWNLNKSSITVSDHYPKKLNKYIKKKQERKNQCADSFQDLVSHTETWIKPSMIIDKWPIQDAVPKHMLLAGDEEEKV